MESSSKKVVVFTLGGTIAMGPQDSGAVVPMLTGDDLVAAIPGIRATNASVEVVDLKRISSASLGLDDLAALSAAIEERLTEGADGAVVVQGTDTLEETAFLLDLWHTGPQPLVVTGAMRSPAHAGPDGPANLLASIRVAASDAASGEGALVVMNDEIHAARRVLKTNTSSPAAFNSPDGGPLGYVVEGDPRIVNRLERRVAMPRPQAADWPRVGLITMTLADDGHFLRGADELDALVVAGFGGGHVPEHMAETLGDLAARMPVVLASRTGGGSVMSSTYGFPGSESDLLGRGLIGAGFLAPVKARVLLLALLSVASDGAAIGAAFDAIGGMPPRDAADE